MISKLKPYIISIVISLGGGIASAFFTLGGMDIYDRIVKPPLSPPPIVFLIVWTFLYIFMGISGAMIFMRKKDQPEEVTDALLSYAVQLILNFFWPLIFFNMQAYLLSFIWLVFLWLVIVKMIIKFYRIKPAAAYLQIPYLIWVTFAGYLNLMIYLLD